MLSYALVAALAGSAIAAPRPQNIDFVAVNAAAPAIPSPSIPVVNAAQATSVVSFNTASASASAAAAVSAAPSSAGAVSKAKRDDSGCAVQPADDDTAQAFLNDPEYSDAANSAATPSGYDLSFQDLQASSNAYGYMGYSTLDSYDTQTCANRCNAITGCSAFNIYFERDPSVDPTADCSNPPSEVVIKCVYWGGQLTSATATNDGQYRMDFHVVIAGSNGYTSNSIATPNGYTSPTYLGNSAINAPLDCNGDNTYITYKLFTSGPFDIGQCAAACTAQTNYNLAHPPATGSPVTCQFFNTYILYDNNNAVGQFCALYNETWPASFATNNGQTRGSDVYTISNSFISSNATDPGTPEGCANPTAPGQNVRK